MNLDIQKIIKINRFKNGSVQIITKECNETPLLLFLKSLGFGKTKINGKRVYFQRTAEELKAIDIDEIRNTFFNILKAQNYTNLPCGMSHEDVIYWYYDCNPIRQNNHFEYRMKEELTEDEKITLRIQYDSDFRKEYLTSFFLKMSWMFS